MKTKEAISLFPINTKLNIWNDAKAKNGDDISKQVFYGLIQNLTDEDVLNAEAKYMTMSNGSAMQSYQPTLCITVKA